MQECHSSHWLHGSNFSSNTFCHVKQIQELPSYLVNGLKPLYKYANQPCYWKVAILKIPMDSSEILACAVPPHLPGKGKRDLDMFCGDVLGFGGVVESINTSSLAFRGSFHTKNLTFGMIGGWRLDVLVCWDVFVRWFYPGDFFQQLTKVN